MKKEYKITLIGCLIILVLDFIGSIASKQLNFNYSYLSIFSFLVYIIIAYKIAKITELKITTLLTGGLGVFDGTIGFIVSQILNANTGSVKIELSLSNIIITAIFMFFLTSIIGIIVWFVNSKFSK